MHDGSIVVRSSEWINWHVLIEVVCHPVVNILQHDFHVKVTVGSGLFMVEAQGVPNLVCSSSFIPTSLSEWDLLSSTIHSNIWPATWSFKELNIVSFSCSLSKTNARLLLPFIKCSLDHRFRSRQRWVNHVRQHTTSPFSSCDGSSPGLSIDGGPLIMWELHVPLEQVLRTFKIFFWVWSRSGSKPEKKQAKEWIQFPHAVDLLI